MAGCTSQTTAPIGASRVCSIEDSLSLFSMKANVSTVRQLTDTALLWFHPLNRTHRISIVNGRKRVLQPLATRSENLLQGCTCEADLRKRYPSATACCVCSENKSAPDRLGPPSPLDRPTSPWARPCPLREVACMGRTLAAMLADVRFTVSKLETPSVQQCTQLFVQRFGRLFRAVQASGSSTSQLHYRHCCV